MAARMNSGRSVSTFSIILKLAVGAYLVVAGIAGIGEYNSPISEISRALNKLFGQTRNPFSLVMAIAQIVAGGAVLLSLAGILKHRIFSSFLWAFSALWIVDIVLTYFAAGFLSPSTTVWLAALLGDAVFLFVFASLAAREGA